MTLDSLYELAEELDIEIEFLELPKIQSISMKIEGDCYIGIDNKQIKGKIDEKMKLLHEICHCGTGSFYNENNKLDIKGKHERTANKRAVERAIPHEDLLNAVENGCVEVWELADHFDVTEDFIKIAIDIYKREGLI